MLVNWPPSKGPKPPHLKCEVVRQVPRVRRWDFKVKPTSEAAAERRALLEAVWEHHNIPHIEEQIGAKFRMKKGRRKREKLFILHHHLLTMASLSMEQADRLIFGYGVTKKDLENALPVKPLSVKLHYPLTRGVEIEVKPWTMIRKWGNGRVDEEDKMTLGYLLWVIATEYRRIYADWKHYNPWGHGIEDLYFEQLEVKRRGEVQIGIGS